MSSSGPADHNQRSGGTERLEQPAGRVVVAVKFVDLRPEIDALTGVISPGVRSFGLSPADEAAVEAALTVAESRGVSVEAVCVSPRDPSETLRSLLARGISSAVWIESVEGLDSAEVGPLVADAAAGASLVVCGDQSFDRGSGSVPTFIALRLGWPVSCGLRSFTSLDSQHVFGVRRLDGGRREEVRVPIPGVISVEPGAFPLRRATLAATLASGSAEIVRVAAPTGGPDHPGGAAAFHRGSVFVTRPIPFRPPTKRVAAPESAAALDRVAAITGVFGGDEPSKTVHATPIEAARLIVEQLEMWGYLADDVLTP